MVLWGQVRGVRTVLARLAFWSEYIRRERERESRKPAKPLNRKILNRLIAYRSIERAHD